MTSDLIILIVLVLLIYNIANESLLIRYGISSDKKFQRLWHTYDAILRVIIPSILLISTYGVTVTSLLLLLSILLIYHVLFDILLNISVAYQRERLSFSRIFHLGNNLLDNTIRNIGLLFTKIKKFNKPITVPVVNCIIKIFELLIGIWLWKIYV